MKPCDTGDTDTCRTISALLARIGDKWSLLVIRTLGGGPKRFNELRRAIDGVSQKMLATTLRTLERDGFVLRTVTPSTPPRVDYELTDLGRGLLVPVAGLAEWTWANADRIAAARAAYDRRQEVPPLLRSDSDGALAGAR